jgi:sugar phosphate isomerase/epimerase
MVAYTRTGFADEISEDLDEQLDVLEELGVGYMDLRGVWGTNVLDLDPDEVADVRAALDERGIGVSAIGSPIGKVDIDDPFDPHFDRFETAIERAHQFDADYIRLFSYWMPEGEDPDDYREEVLGRMETKAERAAEADVVLIHENEKDIYGDTPARCRDILASVDSPHLRAVFDPANFLEVGVRPYPDGLLQLVEYVDFLHIKDAEFGQRGAIAPAGQGDGRIPETLEALAARGFEGFASLEPHLAQAGEYGGYSGPDAFHVACEALEDCFDEAGVDYE